MDRPIIDCGASVTNGGRATQTPSNMRYAELDFLPRYDLLAFHPGTALLGTVVFRCVWGRDSHPVFSSITSPAATGTCCCITSIPRLPCFLFSSCPKPAAQQYSLFSCFFAFVAHVFFIISPFSPPVFLPIVIEDEKVSGYTIHWLCNLSRFVFTIVVCRCPHFE